MLEYEGKHPIVATRALVLTPPEGPPARVIINIRAPHAVQAEYSLEWSSDYEFLVGQDPPHLRTAPGMDSLSALYTSLLIIGVTLDDLRTEGALTWPDGKDDVGVPGIVVHRGREPLDSRPFEPKLALYTGDRRVIGSYEAEFTAPGAELVLAVINVREPRFDDELGWLADWDLVVGGEMKAKASGSGVDSIAALHAAITAPAFRSKTSRPRAK